MTVVTCVLSASPLDAAGGADRDTCATDVALLEGGVRCGRSAPAAIAPTSMSGSVNLRGLASMRPAAILDPLQPRVS